MVNGKWGLGTVTLFRVFYYVFVAKTIAEGNQQSPIFKNKSVNIRVIRGFFPVWGLPG